MIETKATEQELFALLKNDLQHVSWPDRLRVEIKPMVRLAGPSEVYEVSVSLVRRFGQKPSDDTLIEGWLPFPLAIVV